MKNFPCMIDDTQLDNIAFNSNIKCKCNVRLPHITVDNKLKLLLTQSNENESWKAHNLDIENEFEENIEIKPNFKYYNVHDFHVLGKALKKQNKLSIFHTNICSMNANVESMQDLLHDLDFKFDILAVTETWNPETTKDKFSPPHINGYYEYYGNTGSSGKGGCGVFINDSLNFITRKDLDNRTKENENEFESCWIELINTKACNTLIGTFYRHPSDHDSIFKTKMKDTVKKLKKEKKKVILCGDFNYNLLEYATDKHVSEFLNTMLENNFQPCITEATRITNTNKPSLVDNIFINTLESLISGNILEHISYDHLPNFIILEHEKTDPNIKIKKRDEKNFNKIEFLNDLSTQPNHNTTDRKC